MRYEEKVSQKECGRMKTYQDLASKTSRGFKEFTYPFSNKTGCLKKVRCDVSKAGSVERELTLVLHSILN